MLLVLSIVLLLTFSGLLFPMILMLWALCDG